MRKDYDVGYGKPPKKSRFKKGSSGNLSGRPCGKRLVNTNEILIKLLSKEMTATSGQTSTKVQMIEALFMTLLKKAMEGHGHSLRIIMDKLDAIPNDYKEPEPLFFRENSESDKLIELFRREAAKYALPKPEDASAPDQRP